MINSIFGSKIESTQRYAQNGKRIPVTKIALFSCEINRIKTEEKDGYSALQLRMGNKLREIRIPQEDLAQFKTGDKISAGNFLHLGDLLKVSGVTKGKGFAGVMKKWGFKGGPRTHGQSDRQRSPGSIGQRSTPGRVYKGKHMAGRMGGIRKSVRGLELVGINETSRELLVKGVVPGHRGSFLTLTKIGTAKKIIPLLEKGDKKLVGVSTAVKVKKESKEEPAEKAKE